MDDVQGRNEGGQGVAAQEEATGGGASEVQIGALLEKRRREQGLSLRDAEQATKIRTRYLESLEREDYASLPDAVYVHGFLKAYANFLGLDGERLSRELKDRRAPRRAARQAGQEGPGSPGTTSDAGASTGTDPDANAGAAGEGRSDPPPPVASGPALGDGAERRGGARLAKIVSAAALALLLLAVVVGALYYVGIRSAGKSAQEEEAPAKSSGPAAEQPEDASSPRARGGEAPDEEKAAEGGTAAGAPAAVPEDTAADGAASETVRATVRVVGSSVGMTIRTDGTVAYDGVAQPGFSQSFEGRQTVQVSAANGGAVEVEANGRNVGRLAPSGQAVTRDFTPDGS